MSLLCAQSLGDFELNADLDADLSAHAVAARSDPVERNLLFTFLASKVNRFAARYRHWDLDPWTFDDVLQATFPVFVDVLDTWQPLDLAGKPAGFGAYFLLIFPRRLAGAVRDMLNRGPGGSISWLAEHDPRLDPLDLPNEATTRQIMADICGQLNAVDSAIFQIRVTTDQPNAVITDLTGLSRRSIHRHWGAIVSIARGVLRKAG
jgi:hypothetical protein